MRIAELKIQPNWMLTIIAEDGRVGNFDVGPTFKTKRLKRFKTKVNLQKSSMVVYFIEWDCGADLSADTIEARWLTVVIPICNIDRYLIRSTHNRAPHHLLITNENFRDRPRFKTDGYGIIEDSPQGYKYIASGSIRIKADYFPDRLKQIFDGILESSITISLIKWR